MSNECWITWLLEGVMGPGGWWRNLSLLTLNRHHLTAHWQGGVGGVQRLAGRGRKSQTNYTPTPHTAGHMTRKTSSLVERAEQENVIQSAEADFPPWPRVEI